MFVHGCTCVLPLQAISVQFNETWLAPCTIQVLPKCIRGRSLKCLSDIYHAPCIGLHACMFWGGYEHGEEWVFECVDKCTANRECSFVSNPPAAYNRHNYCLNQSHTLPSKLGLATNPSSPKLQPCTALAKGDHHAIALVLNLSYKFKGNIAHSHLPKSRLIWGISLPLATSPVAVTQPITSVTRRAAPLADPELQHLSFMA